MGGYKITKGCNALRSSRPTVDPANRKRKTATETDEDPNNISGSTDVEYTVEDTIEDTVEAAPSPPKKRRTTSKTTKEQAALTAAIHAAILPCLDLIDPFMEFTRACATIQAGSARQKYVDEQEQRVRAIVDELRGALANPPAPESPEPKWNKYGEAYFEDSKEVTSDEEVTGEEGWVKKPRKKKMEVILRARGEGVVKEAGVEEGLDEGSREGEETGTKKRPIKRKTEVEKLGPVQDEHSKSKLRRAGRVKDSMKALARGRG